MKVSLHQKKIADDEFKFFLAHIFTWLRACIHVKIEGKKYFT